MLVPVKLAPDPKARGWKPAKGWYFYDTEKLQAVLLERRFNTKKLCQAACDLLNTRAKGGL